MSCRTPDTYHCGRLRRGTASSNFHPQRDNLGLSVAICFFIGTIETLGLLPQEIHSLSQHHGFWGVMYNFNINTAGFIIVGMFIVTWAVAMLIWRYGHIEEKWSARLNIAATPAGAEITGTAS